MDFTPSRQWQLAGLLLSAFAAHATPVVSVAEEDFSVFDDSDVVAAGSESDGRILPELLPLQRWIDTQRRVNDAGLIEEVPGAEVLVDLAEAAPSRAGSSSVARRAAPVFFSARPLQALDALPETPIDPLATAAMQRIDSLAERRVREPSSEDLVDLRGLLPSDLVQFVRENRPWVVGGGTGLLLLFWLGSAMLSRRQN
jgi:hypothetical protein